VLFLGSKLRPKVPLSVNYSDNKSGAAPSQDSPSPTSVANIIDGVYFSSPQRQCDAIVEANSCQLSTPKVPLRTDHNLIASAPDNLLKDVTSYSQSVNLDITPTKVSDGEELIGSSDNVLETFTDRVIIEQMKANIGREANKSSAMVIQKIKELKKKFNFVNNSSQLFDASIPRKLSYKLKTTLKTPSSKDKSKALSPALSPGKYSTFSPNAINKSFRFVKNEDYATYENSESYPVKYKAVKKSLKFDTSIKVGQNHILLSRLDEDGYHVRIGAGKAKIYRDNMLVAIAEKNKDGLYIVELDGITCAEMMEFDLIDTADDINYISLLLNVFLVIILLILSYYILSQRNVGNQIQSYLNFSDGDISMRYYQQCARKILNFFISKICFLFPKTS
jgi:hypothetical protein